MIYRIPIQTAFILIACFTLPLSALGQKTVHVGILHSESGSMAISETSLRDVLYFAFEEINAAGGVLGRQIEPHYLDGASSWPVFAEKTEELMKKESIAAVFGCWTSASRKAVLPVFEKYNGLLMYSVQYEGEEESPNIFTTAETVNQQALPAVDYLLEKGVNKFFLLGSDYVYPRTTNLVLMEYLLSKGVPMENIAGGIQKDDKTGDILSVGTYTPIGHEDYSAIVKDIKAFTKGGKACVINTLNGDTNLAFFKEYAAAELTAKTCPVMSFSLSEDEFRRMPTKDLAGQLGCWAYFQSIPSTTNQKFVTDFLDWIAKNDIPGITRKNRVTSSPMALSYCGVYLWKAAVEKAGSFDVDRVREALQSGVTFDGPGGRVTTQTNMHITKTVFIGELKADGQFKLLKRIEDIRAEPWLKGTFR